MCIFFIIRATTSIIALVENAAITTTRETWVYQDMRYITAMLIQDTMYILQGAKGPRGADGEQGPDGYPGAQGINGTVGEDGDKGEPGQRGYPGYCYIKPGKPGLPGHPGAAGEKVCTICILDFTKYVYLQDTCVLC